MPKDDKLDPDTTLDSYDGKNNTRTHTQPVDRLNVNGFI